MGFEWDIKKFELDNDSLEVLYKHHLSKLSKEEIDEIDKEVKEEHDKLMHLHNVTVVDFYGNVTKEDVSYYVILSAKKRGNYRTGNSGCIILDYEL